LADEVACKVRDALAGLFAAHVHANDPVEKRFAGEALASRRILELSCISNSRPSIPSCFREP
jgi:hypothetical protein